MKDSNLKSAEQEGYFKKTHSAKRTEFKSNNGIMEEIVMKRRISLLLTVCMVLTLTLGLLVPAGADSVAGGEIIPNGKGVMYTFSGVQEADKNEISSKYPNANNYNDQYGYYRNGDGIVFAVYMGGNPMAEVSGTDTLKLKNISNNGVAMSFVSGFNYPKGLLDKFWDIDAIAIRYRVTGQAEGETINFYGKGSTDTWRKRVGSCELPVSEEWAEVSFKLERVGEDAGQPFSNWGGEYEDVVRDNILEFRGLSKGATIEIAYIGLFQSADEARAEINARNSIRVANRTSYANEGGQVFRFTHVYDAKENNQWKADGDVVLYAPTAGRTLSNDADGNLVMVTKAANPGDYWDPICFYGLTYGSARVVEMRYKTTDADGKAVNPPEFKFTKENFKVAGMTATNLETSQDKNGWYVTRASFESAVQPQSGTGLTAVTFPIDTSIVYTIDYVGFFQDEAAADANTKRARVFADDAVKYYAAQAKTDGTALRFVGVIDDYKSGVYEEFGFKFCLGKPQTDSIASGTITKYVYNQIMANDELVGIPSNFVTGQGEDSAFFTYCINNIPDTAFEDGKFTIKVCTYAKIAGEEICGPTYTVVYDRTAGTITCS